ncbi:hypothetical protein IU459_17880 [Nocardia amamiensis]|uniref:Uncharacterized protein n=1 Tax=Nocardia amamiensis TaxID=404578 RepID=A0ABS0CS09_9NOCA|nr:hypothetical protein [Nocardia amamiensis]MBF6299397.1 hypothetical protein [Nocardia amamiensis]
METASGSQLDMSHDEFTGFDHVCISARHVDHQQERPDTSRGFEQSPVQRFSPNRNELEFWNTTDQRTGAKKNQSQYTELSNFSGKAA